MFHIRKPPSSIELISSYTGLQPICRKKFVGLLTYSSIVASMMKITFTFRTGKLFYPLTLVHMVARFLKAIFQGKYTFTNLELNSASPLKTKSSSKLSSPTQARLYCQRIFHHYSDSRCDSKDRPTTYLRLLSENEQMWQIPENNLYILTLYVWSFMPVRGLSSSPHTCQRHDLGLRSYTHALVYL